MAVHALKARFVFPVSARPIAHGMVGFENGRITGVGKRIAADTVEDLGNVAILPGLVNAHTHLEFSDLQKPLGQPGIGFVDWIRRVIEYRVGRGASNSAAIEKGLSECARCGVTAIGEIAQMDCTTTTEHAPAADGISFLEIIAPTPDRAADAVEFLENDFNKSQILNNPSPRAATRGLNGVNNPAHNSTSNPSEFDWRLGLSPHAPYSVHPKLLEKIIELSVRHQVPLAMHLAESREEIEYLAQGAGPLKDLLIELGAYDPSTVAPGSRPLDYLQMLAVAHRVMIVHGNFLTHDEIGLLADHAETMSVVYCPRTHAFFRRDRYPL
ncbi:MAG: amidohydrolase family protein, partial [Thermoguttaceae bacterium]